jgi:hypothetical protein
MENHNAKSWPKLKTAKFLTAGLVSYKDVDAGIALLKNQTINEALESFQGKPVIIDHSDVTPANYEKYRKGNVVAARFNPQDAWYYVDFLVDSDEAIDCIENKGYSVSCAYNVMDVGAGGLYQDIPYDGEITKISFTHLALVTEPRYEESKILNEMPLMMVNSKIPAHNISKQEEQNMFKLFKKNTEGKQEEVSPFVMINGKEIKLESLVETYVANEKTGDMSKSELYMAKDADIVDVNGNKVCIGDLKSAYMSKMEKDGVEDKKNEKEDEQEKDVEKEKDKKGKAEVAVEEEEKRAKKNDKEEEKDMKENAKQKGDEYFAQLHQAENRKDVVIDETGTARFSGMTRQERANGFRDRIVKNMSK